MRTLSRTFWRYMPYPKLGWSFVAAICCAIATLWLLGAAGHFAEPQIGMHFPKWSWRYGTSKMQRTAAMVLIKQITLGMSFNEAFEVLGPGCGDWPSIKNRKLRPEETVGFNVRANYNNGIDVGFRDGRVVTTFYYD